MKVINLSSKPSILTQFLSELRDVNIQSDRMRFRENIRRIGHIEAYEVSRLLTYRTENIKTPITDCEVQRLDENIVLGTVFRAGLPLHDAFLDFFDKADNAFVSAYRYYLNREGTNIGVNIEYLATPSLEGKTLIIVDPMLATGESMELAYKAFINNGTPSRLIMVSVIAAKSGVDHLRKVFPEDDVTFVTAAIDPSLNDHLYIVPGLGDAGDLMYGEKLNTRRK